MDRFKFMYRKKEDRISLLPDYLLLEIISRLEVSTKEVIKATTTISKRWRHLWTRLPTLIFTYEDYASKGYSIDVFTDYLSFIDKTLTQCPTNVNLKKLKIHISDAPTLHVNRWIRYAITCNVQEIDLRITDDTTCRFAYCDDELFYNNSCLISMKLSGFAISPPNGAIRWDKLKCLCIRRWELDKDLIGKILSGSPCLETLELNCCYFGYGGRIPMSSLFGNFGVLESLSCDLKTYESFSCSDDELLGDGSETPELLGDESEAPISMKLSRCVFNPPNGAISMDKLKFLCIDKAELDEYSIGKLLSGSPCLETLQLNDCCGFTRIDITSKSVKNLVLSSDYGYSDIENTLEINAPYILSLTIKGERCLEQEFLLQDVSSLVKADLNYWVDFQFAKQDQLDDVEEELLQGLLSSLGHVNEITLGGHSCLRALSRLEAKGFRFRKGSDLISLGSFLGGYRIFPLNHE